jgi:hypothetical protein
VNGRRRTASILMTTILLSILLAGVLEARAQEAAKTQTGQTAIAASKGEAAAPTRPPKERMGVVVLLAWVWLSIAVMIGILRLRVREADRVFRMGLHKTGHNISGGAGD